MATPAAPVAGAPIATLAPPAAPGADKPPPERGAAPFDAPADVEAGGTPDPAAVAGPRPFKAYTRAVKINWFGALAFGGYLVALAFYLYVRTTKTLDLGAYTWYGGLVLAVEMLGATSVLIYGVTLVLTPAPAPPPPVDPVTGLPVVGDAYHVRVVVPCYKESLVRK
jgi:hypothetical protein